MVERSPTMKYNTTITSGMQDIVGRAWVKQMHAVSSSASHYTKWAIMHGSLRLYSYNTGTEWTRWSRHACHIYTLYTDPVHHVLSWRDGCIHGRLRHSQMPCI